MSKKDEALKLALEALEYMAEDLGRFPSDIKAITAIREALAEQPAQQQEPVKACATGQCPCKSECDSAQCCLYTSPPASKPWVGLTDGERLDAERLADQQYVETRGQELRPSWASLFCRDIEAKLREKNNG